MSALDALDRAIIVATQGGLPLVAAPYAAVAAEVGATEAEVIDRLARMAAAGVIRRIGAVPNHYALGYRANGMTVWDVPDAEVDRWGEAIGALAGVSHCYQRPRHGALWPFNLFAMLHGKDRSEVEAQAQRILAMLGPSAREHRILYSTRILKKTGLRLSP